MLWSVSSTDIKPQCATARARAHPSPPIPLLYPRSAQPGLSPQFATAATLEGGQGQSANTLNVNKPLFSSTFDRHHSQPAFPCVEDAHKWLTTTARPTTILPPPQHDRLQLLLQPSKPNATTTLAKAKHSTSYAVLTLGR